MAWFVAFASFHGVNIPLKSLIVELGRDAHSRLSQPHELAPVYRAVSTTKDRPSAVPDGAPGCVLKFLPQFM